jgi:hypothetical protein
MLKHILTTVALTATALPACQPPVSSTAVLGNIAAALSRAKPVDGARFSKHPATCIAQLPGGQLYFEVPSMDIDDDGSADGSPANWESHPVRAGNIDTSHDDRTSYGWLLPVPHGQTDFISPFKAPYVVLPGGKPLWFAQFGIAAGDGAVVIKGGQAITAVFADSGPPVKIGEMSIKAHQMFGVDTFEKGLRPRLGPDGKPLRDPQSHKILVDPAIVTRNKATTGPFIVIVIPHTSAGKKFVSFESSLKEKTESQFHALTTGAQAPR